MPLTAVLEKLYARRRFGICPGVDRVAELLHRLGNPERNFHTIHVAGTNGKGSTSAFLSSILCNSGIRTGQFSSPHLISFTERFRINGQDYPEDKLAGHLTEVLKQAPDEATFFEITTALAAYIFSQENIEWAVMEAGMGGGSDATAAFKGELTVLTPISLDHTEYLGTTLDKIAHEKCAIIKPDTRVITSVQHNDVLRIITQTATGKNCRLERLALEFTALENEHGTLDYKNGLCEIKNLTPSLAGRYQTANCAVAVAAAQAVGSIGPEISIDSIRSGVAKAVWSGRMQLIKGKPPILLDGAHNGAGAAALAVSLADYSYAKLIMVTGVCSDKDIADIYQPLLPLVDRIFTVAPTVERALPAEKLADYFAGQGLAVTACDSVAHGIEAAGASASENDLILVCGSLFVVGECLALLAKTPFQGIRG